MSPKETLDTLKRRSQFLAAAATKKRWVAPGFILQIGDERPAKDQVLYGLTASSKIGNAVVRNRARRRLRALAREILAVHAIKTHDYILIARNTTGSEPYDTLRNDMIKGLKRLKLWREA